VQFYLLVPLLTRLLHCRASSKASGNHRTGSCGDHLSRLFVHGTDVLWPSVTREFLQFFLIGIPARRFLLCEWRGECKAALVWDVVAVVGWCIVAFSLDRTRPPSVSCSGDCVPTLLCSFSKAFFLYSHPGKSLAGDHRRHCYTIYLLHYQIITLVFHAVSHWCLQLASISTLCLQFLSSDQSCWG